MFEDVIHEPFSGSGSLNADFAGVLDIHDDRDTRVQAPRRYGFVRSVGEHREIWDVVWRGDNDSNV